MARARSTGNGRLEEAMAQLTQNMAILIQNQASFLARVSETDRIVAQTRQDMVDTNRRNEERFARIEALLVDHTRILTELVHQIEDLRDTVRDKIGFKPAPQASSTS